MCIILPNGHFLRGVSGDVTTTMSPTAIFFFSGSHFVLSPMYGNHSLSHLCQKCRTISCTFCHRFLRLNCFSSTAEGEKWPPTWPWRKWFGVEGVSSSGFEIWYVRGREFNRPSVHVNIVTNSSSLTSVFRAIALIAFFADFIMLSWTPPKCEAKGGLKFHLIPLFL